MTLLVATLRSCDRAGCLSGRLLYNRSMPFDPANPPIWLRKLHVASEQISPDDYARTPEEGLLAGCRLSDAIRDWSLTCARALGWPPLPPRLPFDDPFRLLPAVETSPSHVRDERVFP